MAGEILELIKDIWSRGTTVLFATHQARLVRQLKRRTLRLEAWPPREGRGLSRDRAFIVSEALRDLRRAGRVGVSAILLIALSLAALGGFWLLSLNLGRAIGQWRDRVRVVVYLQDEPPAGQARRSPAAGSRRWAASSGCATCPRPRPCNRSSARSAGRPTWPTSFRATRCPPRVEVTPDSEPGHPRGTRALVRRLAALPEVEEVQGGAQWVEGLAQFQRLFQLVGLGVGAVLALAAILTVTTATTLVLHLRRDEMEIMRLVGAAESVIRLPRLLQGMAQGLVAGTLALAVLEAAFALAAPRLEPLLPVTLGLQRAVFLSVPQMLGLIGGGAALGAIGGLLATTGGPPHDGAGLHEGDDPARGRRRPGACPRRRARRRHRSATAPTSARSSRTSSRRRSASTRSARRRRTPRSARQGCLPSSNPSTSGSRTSASRW